MNTIKLMIILSFSCCVGTATTEKNETKGALPMETITLGSGCFWCVEAIFEEVKGVETAISGYSGGKTPNPTYKEICTGRTGHAEVCQVSFDPSIVSLENILQVFFKSHDPTTLNKQGADVGTQYRSVIFYHSEEQRKKAAELLGKLDQAGIWEDPIVTAIEPFTEFYKAENVHQNFYANNQQQSYCRVVITPKMEKFRKLFDDLRKK